jgi:predicted nucleotide-binding protein
VTIDKRLLERLEKKLQIGRRSVYGRIAERGRALVLPPEQAAIALALESRVSVRGIATSDDLAAVRGAAVAQAPTVAAPPPARTPKTKTTARKPAARRTAARRRRRTKRGKKVFVVHGRDDDLRKSMFRLLRALKLEPIEWSEAVKATKKGAPYIGEVLDKAFRDASAVVVLLTPDDQARLKKSLAKESDPKWETTLTGQARPNVLFEAGMAFGRHEVSTILVQVGTLRNFSDIGGRHVIRLHNGAEARQELADRLETAGCAIDTSGKDWFSEGNFGKPPSATR